MEPTLSLRALEARIASMERRLLRMKLLLGGMGVASGVALLMGQASPAPPGELIVRRLQVVTERGTRVVDLGSTTRGPYLDLKDTEGRPLVAVSAQHGEGASLTLTDGTGVERVRLRGSKDDAAVTLFDSQARERMRVSATDRATELSFADSTGAARLTLRSTDRAATELALTGPDMVERAGLRIDGAGRPTLSLNEPRGLLSAAIGSSLGGGWGVRVDKGNGVGSIDLALDPDGAPRIQLSDTRERRAVLGVGRRESPGGTTRTEPSSLMLFNNTGKLIWSAP